MNREMKFKKIFTRITIAAAISVFVGWLCLKFCWLPISSFDDMKYNAGIVERVKTPPANFLAVWDKLYPNSRNNSMNRQLWSDLTEEMFNTVYNNCTCDEIGYTALDNDNFKFRVNVDKVLGRYRQFGYGLEYYTTPDKCWDFWINHDIIWKGRYLENLNELSVIQLQKNTEALNQDEIITLIAYRNLGYLRSRDTAVVNNTARNLKSKLAAL